MPNPVINRRLGGGPKFNSAPCAIVLTTYDGGGDSFECYGPGVKLGAAPLAGTFFNGRWFDDQSYSGVTAFEDFDDYSVGAEVGGLSGGTGYDGVWVDEDPALPLDGSEPVTSGDYRYYRLLILSNNGDPDYSGVLEIELRESVGGADETAPGGTITASSTLAGFGLTRGPDQAIDNNLASGEGWIPQTPPQFPEWLQYDFGVGVTKKIVEYRVGSYATLSTTAARSIKDWTLQGSNDGVSWTDVHPVGAQTGWVFGEMRTFPS